MDEKEPADFYDIDGTMFRWQLIHSVVERAEQMGFLPTIDLSKVNSLLVEYKEHRGSFDDFAHALVEAYVPAMEGVRVQDMELAVRSVMSTLGGRTFRFPTALAEASRRAGRHRVIISGSLDEAVRIFAEHHGIGTWYGTELHTEMGLYHAEHRKVWYHDKGEAVLDAASRKRIDLAYSLAIGDSTADISMFEKVGFPICFNPDVELYRVARKRGWAVVRERKNLITIQKPNTRGLFQETSLREILPIALWPAMESQTELMKQIDPR